MNEGTESNPIDRSRRHTSVPLMRGLIDSLFDIVRAAKLDTFQDGLAVNINASFALELSLKIFYMSFNEEGPKNTHELKKLWKRMPESWRQTIDDNYRANLPKGGTIQVYGFQRADNAPERPETFDFELDSAAGFFASMSGEFVRSRYFHEEPSSGDWTFTYCPRDHMLLMLDILREFYDHLLSEAR